MIISPHLTDILSVWRHINDEQAANIFAIFPITLVLLLSVYWPTLMVESNGHGWVRMLIGLLVVY